MNLINDPTIQRRLQRGLNMKEPTPAPTLAPEVVPVVLVHDLTKQEDAFEVRRPCIGGSFLIPTVGQFASVALVNPAGSGILVQIEFFVARAATALIVSAQIDPDFLFAGYVQSADLFKTFRDSRLIVTRAVTVPQAQLWTRDGLAAPQAMFYAPASTAPFTPIVVDVTLDPGAAFIVSNEAGTTGLNVGFQWVESSATR